MLVSIIIVSWNTKKLIDECLASIYKETKTPDFEIFVVDNNSSDGSVEMIREKYPNVHLIANKENRGFAAANNQAIKNASGKYILVLNPDTIILNGAIEKAVKKMEESPEVGILGPKTYNKDGSIQRTVRRDPTLIASFFILSKLQKLFPDTKSLVRYYYKDFDYSKESEVRQTQGSFMLVRREIFDKLGPFDEKFFIWFEEVDLCLRARKAGWKILYFPDTEIIHYGGESFSQVGTFKKQKMFFRSMFYFFKKHKLFKN